MLPAEWWNDFKPWLIVIWTLYVLVLAGWIVMQKREPIATLTWLLSLAALPVVGLLIYHFLGPQRIVRQRRRRSLSRRTLEATLPEDLVTSDDSATVSRLAQAITHFAPSSAADVKLLVGGEATFAALHEAIEAAVHHLHLEYYIFEDDHTGTRLRDALVAKAREGVRVRLLLDAFGSAKLGSAFLAPLRDAGVEVCWFHPVRLRWVWRPRMNMRNHRKIVIVDGCIAFTGGVNVTDEENEAFNPKAFHDLHLRLEGSIVRWLQLAFLEDWHYGTGTALRDDKFWPEPREGQMLAHALPSGPDSVWESIHRVKVETIHQADRRIWMVTPYFVPGEAARMALTSAAMRGLDVRVIVPAKSDSSLVSAAARSYYDELLAAGIRVFEYQPRMLHSKALLVDDETCIVGSANFDHRSFRLNFELSVLLHDHDLASELEKEIEATLAQCREVKAGDPPLPFLRRLADNATRLLSPLL